MITIVKKRSMILFISFLLTIPTFTIGQIIPYDSDAGIDNYQQMVEKRRTVEEASFRVKETTLLSDTYFENFTGLNYYAIDINYRIKGKLTRLPKSEKMNLDLTDGTPYGFMHFGKINFTFDGEDIELVVFEFPSRNGPPSIFVPFTDMTTGKENFGGGRFLVIKIPQGDEIIVDFNMAINPICVYDPEHACPVSPKSNYIPKRITAGAKMYYDPKELNADN